MLGFHKRKRQEQEEGGLERHPLGPPTCPLENGHGHCPYFAAGRPERERGYHLIRCKGRRGNGRDFGGLGEIEKGGHRNNRGSTGITHLENGGTPGRCRSCGVGSGKMGRSS